MDLDTIIGLILLVLGVLVLLGELGVGFLLPILGVVLVVLGALMLLNIVSGGTLFGIVTIVVGLLLYLDQIGVPGPVSQAINLIVGVVLVVLGILQIR